MEKAADELHVGVAEAKARLSALLERVAFGTEVVILRHGVRVARLVAEGPGHRLGRAQAAVRGLAALRAGLAGRGVRLGVLEAKALRAAPR